MAVTMKLTRTESKLFARDPIAMFFGLIFPTTLLVALGFLFPGFTDRVAELDGGRFIDTYSPIIVALGIATLGLVTLPPILGLYRQHGILRRLKTTPVHPGRLLTAQLVVHGTLATVSAVLGVVSVAVFFDVPLPQSPFWFVVSFLLAVASIFALGLVVGALVRTSASGQAVGMAIYFPMLFFAGVWIPRTLMGEGLRLVSDLTPLGSAVQALNDSWFGTTPSLLNLAVMAVYTVVAGVAAVRFFRWE